jgi:uncharacterized membrane-anchored protein
VTVDPQPTLAETGPPTEGLLVPPSTALINHPLRDRVVSEMHMRRMPALTPPMLMAQVVRLIEPEDQGRERAHGAAMPGVPRQESSPTARHLSGRAAGDIEYAWERHSEATTATIFLPRPDSDVFAQRPEDAEALAWLGTAPGGVIRAVKVGIVSGNREGEVLAERLGFSGPDLVSCRIGRIRIWSDFLLHGDGYGRLLVAANGTPPADLGRIVQRIQEVGNYRNMALLGLPVAQEQSRNIAEAEERLVAMAARMAAGEGDRALLDELCELSSQVAAINAATAFRMSATAAYTSIALDRLRSLPQEPIEGYPTLEEFTERRLLPAARTCESFTRRLETLSARIERATSLLRTRVEMSVQDTNLALLSSMTENASRQVKLQKLVEGFSVMAVTYYTVGLLFYLLKGVAPPFIGPPELLVGILVVPVFVAVLLFMRARVREIDEGRD